MIRLMERKKQTGGGIEKIPTRGKMNRLMERKKQTGGGSKEL
jgi:hypothetical protein